MSMAPRLIGRNCPPMDSARRIVNDEPVPLDTRLPHAVLPAGRKKAGLASVPLTLTVAFVPAVRLIAGDNRTTTPGSMVSVPPVGTRTLLVTRTTDEFQIELAG